MSTPLTIAVFNGEEEEKEMNTFELDNQDFQKEYPRLDIEEVVNDVVGNTLTSVNDGDNPAIIPVVGMKFESTEALYEFYRSYAYHEGFPIRVASTRKGPDGKLRYFYLECSRAGGRESTSSNPFNSRPTGQSGCKARVRAVSDVLGVWRISKVNIDHNHILSPTKSRLYACNRRLDPLVKRQLDMNDRAGIRVCQTFEAVAIDAGGYENVTYDERDCWNYSSKSRKLRLGEGDAAALQAYFRRMQLECPGFYFDIDMDEDGRLRNVFWADNRSREAYKEFGDVVSFDTTYLVNKYQMPFAPFVGVNHHGQSILLGCGLLASENTDSFVWVFSAWLKCMGGKAPIGIITDQDLAMKAAIPQVFPNTLHRWCLWHIMKKLPEKIGARSDKEDVIEAIKDAIYDSHFSDEFEDAWEELVVKYRLQDLRWQTEMYSERARWVPCYLKTNFWAGMSSTQRSESMNAFFKDFVNSRTSLKQFVEQYDRAVRKKIEKEVKADHKSTSTSVRCVTHFGIERQFQKAYSHKKFQKGFQKEMIAIFYCRVDAVENDPPGVVYRVSEQIALGNNHWKRKEFIVSFVRENLIMSCNCNLFEFQGIVCRHSLKVLVDLDIHEVHERYVLRRWRKDVRRVHSKITIGDSGWTCTPEKERQDRFLRVAARMSEMISVDKEYTDSIIELLEQKMREFLISHPSLSGERYGMAIGGHFPSNNGAAIRPGESNLLDPLLVRRKGAPRKNRLKGPIETNSKRKKVSSKKKAMGNGGAPTGGHQEQMEFNQENSQNLLRLINEGLSGNGELH